ncbi:FAD-dependent oxidoreductase [Streptomyces mobaraensis]|uniref:FAD-dependent oxidoreductase n=1 Tax=Streptomyces mobaraensis TaxID=35621 RepID=UPI003325D432
MESCREAGTAVIVGAGVAGLTAATALARDGWQVEIAETGPPEAAAGWGLCRPAPRCARWTNWGSRTRAWPRATA